MVQPSSRPRRSFNELEPLFVLSGSPSSLKGLSRHQPKDSHRIRRCLQGQASSWRRRCKGNVVEALGNCKLPTRTAQLACGPAPACGHGAAPGPRLRSRHG